DLYGMRRSVLSPTVGRPDVLVQMIGARVLARSAYSQGARDRSLFVSRGVSGRVEAAPWARA
ncbi:MAG: hypothetical protein ACRDH5_13475, partial [bacterium]